MKLRRLRAVLTIALAWALSFPARALASETSVAAVTAAVIRDLDLQTELPHATTPWHLPLPGYVIWAIVALILVFLLYSMRDYIPLLRRPPGQLTAAERLAA